MGLSDGSAWEKENPEDGLRNAANIRANQIRPPLDYPEENTFRAEFKEIRELLNYMLFLQRCMGAVCCVTMGALLAQYFSGF